MTLTTPRWDRTAEPLIMLPDHPQFGRILATPPPEPDRSRCFVARSGSGVLEAVNDSQLDDYLEGGEYDQVMAVWDEETPQSDVLYLPVSVGVKS